MEALRSLAACWASCWARGRVSRPGVVLGSLPCADAALKRGEQARATRRMTLRVRTVFIFLWLNRLSSTENLEPLLPIVTGSDTNV